VVVTTEARRDAVEGLIVRLRESATTLLHVTTQDRAVQFIAAVLHEQDGPGGE
jgi:hypothetical protein